VYTEFWTKNLKRGDKPLGRPGCGWEDNITMSQRNRIRWRGLDSCCSEWGSVAGFCEYDEEPSVSIIGCEFLKS